jgi:peptide/nickel transport system substrate-binding protein
MRMRSTGFAAVVSVAGVLSLGVAACGSSSNDNKSSGSGNNNSASTATSTPASGGGKTGGTITVAQGTAPDYLDPSESYTTQGVESTWLAYTGLYTYAHKSGVDGGKVIPGIAQDYPQISSDGKTYTLTIRQGLKYSDGSAVKASDFPFSVERAIKLNWGGKSFLTGYIKGASAYDTGKSKDISGIKADDSTGKITIELTQPYGAFLNVLAFPNVGFLPQTTAMKNLSSSPPPGVGPYIIKNVVPNRSYDVVRNPDWTDNTIPGIPAGKADISVKIATNTQTEAENVLNNSEDIFDWGDQIPPALMPQVQSQASDRFKKQNTISTFYFFLNTQTKPFNNMDARIAVNYAVDRRALARLNGGNFLPTCWFLPQGLAGHPSGQCPYGDPNAAPDMAKAKQYMQKSGMTGQSVTVWSETRSPRKEFVAYLTDVLNQLGFKAKTKIIADAEYFPTIGNLKTNPQVGFADWNQDFPNPSDFYLLLDKNSIQPTNNENFSQVNDPKIQSALAKLNPVSADKLDSVADQWAQLDTYVAQQAYIVAYGQQQAPQFYSNKVDFGSAVFHPLYGTDFSSLQLKG